GAQNGSRIRTRAPSHLSNTDDAENERERHEQCSDFAGGVVEIVEHGLKSRWKVRIRFVEVGQGCFRFRGESGELAVSFAADFLGSDFLLDLTILIEHVEH